MNVQINLCDTLDELSVHDRKNLVAALRELLDTVYDAAAGYETAAESATDHGLAQLFRGCAAERREAAAELAGLLHELGELANPHETVGGELHRALMKARAAISDGGAAAILSECERGEHLAVRRYERALTLKMPQSIASVLLEHVTELRDASAAFDRMRHPW